MKRFNTGAAVAMIRRQPQLNSSEQDSMELKCGVLSGHAAKDYLFGKKFVSDDPAIQLCWGSGYRAVRPQSFDEVVSVPRCSEIEEVVAPETPRALAIHRGRPRKSVEDKRKTRASRQWRYRNKAA